jgi:hypothetical protein
VELYAKWPKSFKRISEDTVRLRTKGTFTYTPRYGKRPEYQNGTNSIAGRQLMARRIMVAFIVAAVLAMLLIGEHTPSFAAMRTVQLTAPGCV